MGLPSYTGGCQYSFDQQVDRQNIVVKIDSYDYPKNTKSDLHSLKCHTDTEIYSVQTCGPCPDLPRGLMNTNALSGVSTMRLDRPGLPVCRMEHAPAREPPHCLCMTLCTVCTNAHPSSER